MPATRHIIDLPVGAYRAVAGLAGIFMLILQLLSPALASPGQSTWMEICSEAGAVWVQVDLESETQDPTAPCPKCADCALCAVTGAAPLPDMPQVSLTGIEQFVRCDIGQIFDLHKSERLWPETRGPPPENKNKIERALRASMASTQIRGVAPWS